ncbi:MAG TPA: PQQ-dependent sugar dehydrogenase [Dehalococcoidia bacterium]|nr:PQQ-dependent sugar dehydrogenase [Dehalococcoidia bacterium]
MTLKPLLLYSQAMMTFLRRASPVLTLVLLVVLALACSGDGEEELPFGLQSEVVTNADRVSDMVFAPDGRMFFAEQFTGAIRVISAEGQLQEAPFAQVTLAEWLALDWGLTGLALDPDFQNNHYVYAFYTAVPGTAGAAPPGTGLVSAVPPAGHPAGGVVAQVSPGPLPPGGATLTPSPAPEENTATPAPQEEKPQGQPLLVRFTDANGVGQDETVISDDFPLTSKEHPGYNGQGNIHFGPDGMLYLSFGDYDDPVLVQDLSTPVGKLLRIDPETGEAPPDNPLVGDPDADPRIYAWGFREPFDFTFNSNTGDIYGTDNTPDTCEELNIIRPGENYGWPDVGEFPYDDCSAGDQVPAIFHFAREGKEPGSFLSLVEVSGLTFVPGARYPSLGDSLFACESQISVVEGEVTKGVLRRLIMALPAYDAVTQSDVIVKDCKGDVETGRDGTLYYSNATEIRRLLPGEPATSGG